MSLTRKLTINAFGLAIGRALVTVTGVLSVGLATRYLGPASFGSLATATAFAALLAPLTDVGTSTIGAREIAKRPEEAREIVGSVLTIGLLLSAATMGLGFATLHLLYPGQQNELVRHGIVLMLFTVPLSAPVSAFSAYFIANQRAYVTMWASAAGGIVTLASLALGVTLDAGFTAVVLAYAAFAIGYAGFLAVFSIGKVHLRPSLDVALGKQLLRWGVPLGAGYVINSLYVRIDLILLSLFSTKREVALYGLAYKVVEAVASLPYFITVTLLPEFARLSQDRVQLSQMVSKASGLLQTAAVPLLLFLAVFANDIVKVVGGERFRGSGSVLAILMIGVAAWFFTSVLIQALIAVNRQSTILATWGGILIVNVALNLVLIHFWGARGAALAYVLSEALAVALLCYLWAREGSVPRLQHLWQVFFAACAMAAAGYAVRRALGTEANPFGVLLIGGAAAFAAYVVVLSALGGMPAEIRAGLIKPVWDRLRR